MKLLSPIKPPIFNLLSLGERGVGKTVFLVGSYAELNNVSDLGPSLATPSKPTLWFECQYSSEKELLESILNYVAQTGHYPPPTLKITDFHFAFKQRQRFGVQNLCYFRWWDIPGEYCSFENPYYQTMILNSHSCCVFINADRLVHDPGYHQSIDILTKQVVSLARLIDRKTLSYSFALIFTQCDRLAMGAMAQIQIEEKIQGLIHELEMVAAKYQRFYAGIPIVEKNGQFKLQANGVSSAFLWLVAELYRKHTFSGARTLESSLKGEPAPSKTGMQISPSLTLILVSILMGFVILVLGSLFFGQGSNPSLGEADVNDYKNVLEREPNNLDALVATANLYLEKGKLAQAIPILEKIVALEPNNPEWQFNLAKLYELDHQIDKAEKIYDLILVKDSRQFKALVAKAMLKQAQGQPESAKTLFQMAEAVAPSEALKKKIQELSQKTLTTPSREN
jgi:tetratricopeptide (TPR) repeat protein